MAKSAQQYIKRMEELLDQLIQAAKALRDASQQVISEEELAPLQQQQDAILAELEKVDQDLHQYYRSELDTETHESFHNKLLEFQMLNQEFIANLRNSHGLIQFELEHASEDENTSEPLWRRLNNLSLKQKRSQEERSSSSES